MRRPASPELPLQGALAWVTGSSRGIGLATATRLASMGADLVLHGRTPSAHLSAAAEALRAHHRVEVVTGDLRKPDHIDAMLAIVRQLGPLHVFVNGAAMASFAPAATLSRKQWDATLAASLSGPWQLACGAAELMGSGWGRLINVSSLGAHRYVPGYAALGAAKAGLESLTRSLAVELMPRGIVVNCVVGGMAKTDAAARFPPEISAMREAYLKRAPGGGPAEPDDIAGVIAMLCRDEARWIVGQTLVADGGFSLL